MAEPFDCFAQARIGHTGIEWTVTECSEAHNEVYGMEEKAIGLNEMEARP